MLELPSNVLINPNSIYLVHKQLDAGGYVQGYNPETEEWENLASILEETEKTTETFSIVGKNYYSKFRTYGKNYSSSATYRQYIYDFKIIKGTIKY